MSTTERSSVRRRPEQLLLAFFGELVAGRGLGPVPTAVLIDVLGDLGVGQAATRATLQRMAGRGLLEPVRSGRTVSYLLTEESERVLLDARDRVFALDPFAPHGEGWTLVSFSVPEARRDVRHRVRAQLTWAGFGLLRDGLWIAPGEVDVRRTLGPELEALSADGLELLAFRAVEVEGFSVAGVVTSAWRVGEIRARHEGFQARWAEPGDEPSSPLARVTALVADWLDLLRHAPPLPAEHLGADWPARGSVAAFRREHALLVGPAGSALRARLAT